MLDIASGYPPSQQPLPQPQEQPQPFPNPNPPTPAEEPKPTPNKLPNKPPNKTPMGILKEDDFYYDSNNDSDYSKGTEEIELYPDNGRGIYDDDIIDDLGQPKKKPEEVVTFKKKQNNKKLEKKQLETTRNKSKQSTNQQKSAEVSEPVIPETVGYIWYHNGTEISANESKRFVLSDGTLYFKKFGNRRGQKGGLQDTGQYRCLAVGMYGAMLSTSTVITFATMSRDFTSFPVDSTVFEGDALQFPCEIESNPAANITWEKNAKPIPESKRYYILNSGSLLITNSQKEDNGDYRCVAVNSILNKTRHSPPASVTIIKNSLPSYPLSFITENQIEDDFSNENITLPIKTTNVSIHFGENLSLGCAVSGKPKPKVVWNFQSDSSETEAKEISSMEVFRILDVKEDNSGLYTCIATNDQQSIQQAYRVTVLLAPYLKQTPTSEHTPTAKTVRFNCSAGGSPPPRISWYKDGRPLNITGRVKLKSQDKRPPELIVSDTISSDRGVYQCIASNSVGEASAWALLAVRALNVPPPSFVRCCPVTKDTVRITWEAPHRLPAVAYTVHFMLTDGGEEHSQILTSNNYDLRKLQPYRSYEFYTKTYTNRRGASDQSPHVVCHGQGVDTYLSSVGNTSMHVAWRDNAPNIKMWQLQWKLIGPNTTLHNVTLPNNVSSYIVEDIHPLNKYEFRVLGSPSDKWLDQDLNLIQWSSSANRTLKPYNKDGNVRGFNHNSNNRHDQLDASSHKQSEHDSSDWLFGNSMLQPTSLAAEATGSRSVNVSWRCDAAEASADGFYFTLCYSERSNTKDDQDSLDPHKFRDRCVDSLNSWMDVLGLEPGTLYSFKVQAVMQNQQRRGPFSETTVCRTKHEVSSAVTDVRWEVLDGGVVKISWTLNNFNSDPSVGKDSDPGGSSPEEVEARKPPVVYTVYYSQDPLAPLPKWSAKNVTNITQLELHDLNTEAVCYVMVSLRGEERGRVIAIPPLTKGDTSTPIVKDTRSELPIADKDTSSDQHYGIALGVVLSVLCVVVCASIILWQRRKLRRNQQGPPNPQIRTNRVARSDFECQELMGQPPHIDAKGGVVYINGVESEVTLGGEVGEPLLNGHVRITENPRFSKKHLPNGNCRPLLDKKTQGPVFDGTLDVSRYEELPDVTVETILEGDMTLDTSAEQVCSDVLSTSTLPMSKPDSSAENNCTSNCNDLVNGVQVHIDRNFNSEVTNVKKVDLTSNDKLILDTKSGAKKYIEKEKEDCNVKGSGPNTRLENAKNNSSVDAMATLDYRENGSTRRVAPALGPNG